MIFVQNGQVFQMPHWNWSLPTCMYWSFLYFLCSIKNRFCKKFMICKHGLVSLHEYHIIHIPFQRKQSIIPWASRTQSLFSFSEISKSVFLHLVIYTYYIFWLDFVVSTHKIFLFVAKDLFLNSNFEECVYNVINMRQKFRNIIAKISPLMKIK